MVRKGPRKVVGRDVVRCHIALDALTEPSVPTERLIRRYYSSTSAASLYKTLARDREALAGEGIHLVSTTRSTAKLWSVDRTRTLAGHELAADEARCVQQALRPLIGRVEGGDPAELGRALVRVGRDLSNHAGPRPNQDDKAPAALSVVTRALGMRRPCELDYQAVGEGEAVTRILLPYGVFRLAGHTYVVGLRRRRGANDAVRTLNLARATAGRVLVDEDRYEIPQDFRIEDYRLLPFEIGRGEGVVATFFVPKAQVSAFRAEARRRGKAKGRGGGSLTWTIVVRDIERAARWAPVAGVIPLDPPALVDTWSNLLGKAAGHDA